MNNFQNIRRSSQDLNSFSWRSRFTYSDRYRGSSSESGAIPEYYSSSSFYPFKISIIGAAVTSGFVGLALITAVALEALAVSVAAIKIVITIPLMMAMIAGGVVIADVALSSIFCVGRLISYINKNL